MAVLTLLFFIISICTILLAVPVAKLMCKLMEHEPLIQLENKLNIPREKQTGMEFFWSLTTFNTFVLVICFLALITQNFLPLNPQNLPGLELDLAINIAISFITGTNWQTYAGEVTLSYFSQMLLGFVSIVASASGIAVAMLLFKGLVTEVKMGENRVFQNYWEILIRLIIYLFVPLCTIFSVVLVSQGTIQNFADYTKIETLEGASYLIAQGPVAIFKSIAMLCVSGGGFFSTNSAHPFENPNDITNIIQIIMMCLIPASLVICYSRILKRRNHGIAILIFVYLLLYCSAVWLLHTESAVKLAGQYPNLEGKELRFGMIGSVLYESFCSLSSGAANSALASFSPSSISLIIANVLIGGFILGGTGTGMLNLMIYILLAVFFSGMMAGRIPQFLGKKVDSGEIKYLMYYVAAYQCLILLFATLTINDISAMNINSHSSELSKVLMMNASTITNNGSIISSEHLVSTFSNNLTSLGMILGRVLLFFCLIKTAISMSIKRIALNRIYEIQTDSTFFFILVSFVVINDFMVFIPVIIIGPLMTALTGN